jgi:hypothetical protein
MRIRITDRTPANAVQRALGRWLPRAMTLWRPQADWRLALIETVAVMAVAIGLSAWWRPLDPLWTNAEFPWLWLVAAVMALRYGSPHALLAMSLALAGWLLMHNFYSPLGEFPRLSFIGGLVLTLIAGEFSDAWNARLAHAHAVNAYLDERLQALTQHHFLLSVSHDRLEQELLSRPFTLRETLFALRQRVQPAMADSSELPAADWLLQLLAQSCRIESAGVFAIRGTDLEERPSAKLGDFGAVAGESGSGDLRGEFAGMGAEAAQLDSTDPMLLGALESHQLMHVQNEPFVDSDRPSRYVVCAPIVGSSGRLFGVLVVERMAFTSLTLETLQFLTVLLAYYGDTLDYAAGSAPILKAFPRCPNEFALEAVRLQRLQTTAFTRSSIVAFSLPGRAAAAEPWVMRLEKLRRNLDVAWTHVEGESRILLVLLPLTDDVGLAGYVDRISRAVREQFGVDLAPEVTVHTRALDENDVVAQLRALIDLARGADITASTAPAAGARTPAAVK